MQLTGSCLSTKLTLLFWKGQIARLVQCAGLCRVHICPGYSWHVKQRHQLRCSQIHAQEAGCLWLKHENVQLLFYKYRILQPWKTRMKQPFELW